MPAITTNVTFDFSVSDCMAATSAAVAQAIKELRANTYGPVVFDPGQRRLRPYMLCRLRKSQRTSVRRQRFELNRFISALRLRHADDAKREVWRCHYDRRGLVSHDSYGQMLRDAKRQRTRDELTERLMRADLRAQLRRRSLRFNSTTARFVGPLRGEGRVHFSSADGTKHLVMRYENVVLHLDPETTGSTQEPSA